MVKAEHVGRARELFADTDINITTEGKRHLGAAVGSRSYTEEYVAGKVAEWSEEIKSWPIFPRHSLKQLTVLSLMVFLAAGLLCYEPFLI